MVKSTVTTKTIGGVSRNAAVVAFAASLLFMIVLAILHVLRPDLDPSWRFISEYELGDYGWLMRLAFLSLAFSCIGLCVALFWQVTGVGGYFGLALLLISDCGMILAAIFVPDRVNRLHEVGAMLDCVPFAALLINWSLSRNEAWTPSRRTLYWTAGLPLVGLAIFIVSMAVMLPRNGGQPGPTVLVGWPNRIMIIAHCAWLMPVAWQVIRITSIKDQTIHAS